MLFGIQYINNLLNLSKSNLSHQQLLHGAEICGIRLKVLEAEEPRNGDDRRKRFKVDEGHVSKMFFILYR